MSAAPSSRRPVRVLYVQFTTPAALPPIEHSARLLADAGCEVRFLGARTADVGSFVIEPHPRISEWLLPVPPGGVALKLAFVRYAAHAVREALRWRPDWIYMSDMLAAPLGPVLTRLTSARLIYHEHDAPAGPPSGRVDRWLRSARRWCMANADRVVFPNAQRYAAHGAGVSTARAAIVWNCPELAELPSLPTVRREAGRLAMLYQGSINEVRLPLALADAMRLAGSGISLTIMGYETVGSRGHVARFLARAREAGVADRVRVVPPLPSRRDLYGAMTGHDLGLCFIGDASSDVNMETMVGASNKAFDYLACGMALLVPPDRHWIDTFVRPGYAVAYGSVDAQSLAASMCALAADPSSIDAMSSAGRRRVESEWNYDAQFATMCDYITSTTVSSEQRDVSTASAEVRQSSVVGATRRERGAVER